MKILLVRAQKAGLALGSEILVPFEPLALEYVGAGVRNNHDVKILDQRVDQETTLEDIMESFQPDIVMMGGGTSEVNPTKKTLAAAKKINPGVLTAVGGHHATVCPQDLFEDYIDVVVVGHDVEPFKKICDCHEKKKSFEDIENIYYRQNGKMAINTKKSFTGWQSMPFPDRTLTAQYRDKYLHPFLGSKVQPFACVSSSISCRFRCKFCAIPKVLDRKVYFREIEDVVKELQAIEEPVVLWVDDEFFLDTKRVLKLADRIHQAGIKKVHLAMCRSDTIIRHPECI